jgi:hypothetical protein
MKVEAGLALSGTGEGPSAEVLEEAFLQRDFRHPLMEGWLPHFTLAVSS